MCANCHGKEWRSLGVDLDILHCIWVLGPFFIGILSATEGGRAAIPKARVFLSLLQRQFFKGILAFSAAPPSLPLPLSPLSFLPSLIRPSRIRTGSFRKTRTILLKGRRHEMLLLRATATSHVCVDLSSKVHHVMLFHKRRRQPSFLPSFRSPKKTALASGDRLSSVRGNNKSGGDDVRRVRQRARDGRARSLSSSFLRLI